MSKLPCPLSPLVTNHPASVAYRVTMSPHEWTWTQEEQIEMAKALVKRDEQIATLKAAVDALRKNVKSYDYKLALGDVKRMIADHFE